MAESEFTIKVKTETDTAGVEDLQTALEDIKSIADETGNDLTQALDDAGGSAESTAENLDDAGSSADNLADSIENVNSGNLDEVSDKAEEVSRSFDDASQSADNFNTGMGVMEGSMLLSASEQIKGIGTSAEDMAVGLDNAQISIGQLATKTGMAEGELTNMINNISNVTFPRDEAIAYTNALNQMGVSNANLGDSATNMDRINDATHMGYSNVIQLTQGLRSVGVDAGNLPSAFNAIAYAEANVNGGAQTMSTVFKRQASTINEYGLTADQVVLIMQKLSEQGVQGMKMGSELSNVLKENNGDITAIEKSLGMQSGALENATSQTDKYNGKLVEMANQEMEHKTATERLGAVWEDLSLTLAPVLSPLGTVVGLLGQVGSLALGINGIITLAETFGLLNTANLALIPSQIAEGIAGMASIAWVLIAVAVILILVGVLWYLYNNNETVRQAIDNFIATLKEWGAVIYAYVVNAINTLISWLTTLWNIAQTIMLGLVGAVQSGNGNILQSIANVIIYLSQLPVRLATIFVNMIAKALGFGDNFVERLRQTAINSVNNFISNISQLPNRLYTELSNTYSYVSKWASELPQKFWDAGVDAVKNFLSALGIASPGTMQRMLIWEITEMGNRIPNESRGLLKNIGQLGSDVVDEFGNPSLDTTNLFNSELGIAGNNADGLGNNYEINIEIGSVDNEERVNEIVEAVRRALAWDNTTAGRTV